MADQINTQQPRAPELLDRAIKPTFKAVYRSNAACPDPHREKSSQIPRPRSGTSGKKAERGGAGKRSNRQWRHDFVSARPVPRAVILCLGGDGLGDWYQKGQGILDADKVICVHADFFGSMSVLQENGFRPAYISARIHEEPGDGLEVLHVRPTEKLVRTSSRTKAYRTQNRCTSSMDSFWELVWHCSSQSDDAGVGCP
ncbi:hypothetical protein BST61_g10634 [Cercospora zeina]